MSEGGSSGTAERITVEEALRDAAPAADNPAAFEYSFENAFNQAALLAEERYIKARGLREHFIHKGWWSGILLLVIVFMVGFQSVLIGLVGVGYWDFTQYSWLLPVLMVQYLAQIVGLAVFVVRSLFRQVE